MSVDDSPFIRPPIDWDKPIEWNDGSPALGLEEVLPTDRTVAIILGDQYPTQLDKLVQRKRHKDMIVVHRDTGVPITTLAEYAPDCYIQNIDRQPREIERLYGTF